MSIAVNDARDVGQALAQWVAALSLADIPADARRVARDCIADGIGVMLAGTRSAVAQAVARLPQHAGACGVAGDTAHVDAASAALRNGAACHAWDFDDTSYAGIVHGTAVVLPAVLAVAQEVGATGAQFLEAFVAGVEVEYALGLALTDSLYERGHWTTTTLGVIGAAAGVAKLRKLSAAQIADAISLAANIPLGLRAIHGSTGKPYLCGMAAKLGVEAVDAVAAGVDVQPNIFGRRRGFADTLNGGVLKLDAIDALGKRFSLVDPGIAYKLHPLCSATQAAIDATGMLMEEHGFTAADVASVQCDGTGLVAACLPYTAPVMPSQAQFSMSFAIGCKLLHGDVGMQYLSAAALADPALVQLMQRIRLQADANLVPAAEAEACPEASRVEICLHDGRIVVKTVLAALGMPQNPAGDVRLLQKFIDCTAPLLAEGAARALWETIHQVDQLQDVHGLLGQPALQET